MIKVIVYAYSFTHYFLIMLNFFQYSFIYIDMLLGIYFVFCILGIYYVFITDVSEEKHQCKKAAVQLVNTGGR